MKLVEGWRRKIWQHVMIGCFWSTVGGFLLVWPALASHVPITLYVIGGVVLSAAYGVAKVLHRPGAD